MKRQKTTPKLEGQFWQTAEGDGGHPRCLDPRAATLGSGHAPGPGPTRVRDAAGGVAERLRLMLAHDMPVTVLAARFDRPRSLLR